MSATATATPANKTTLDIGESSIAGVIIWVGIFLVVAFVGMILYEVFRRRSKWRKAYYTRVLFDVKSQLPIPKKTFEWIKIVYNTPESVIAKESGLDAVIYLRFLKMCISLFGQILLLMFTVIVPVNFFAPRDSIKGDILVYSLQSFSISNIAEGSDLFWVHVVCAYIITGLTYYHLYVTYKRYVEDAALNLLNPQSELHRIKHRTVLIKHLPENLDTKPQLQEWIEGLGIGRIHSIHLNTSHTHDIEKIYKQYKKILYKLENAYMKWAIALYRAMNYSGCLAHLMRVTSNDAMSLIEHEMSLEDIEKSRPFQQSLRPKLMVQGESVDTIKYYFPKLRQLEKEIMEKRSPAYKPRRTPGITRELNTVTNLYRGCIKVSPSAFVTFEKIQSASIMSQMLMTSNLSAYPMEISAAPMPNEVIWENLSKSIFEQKIVRWVISFGSFLICAIWVLPTYFVAKWAVTGIPEFALSYPFLAAVLQQIAPPLIILTSNASMPFVLYFFTTLQSISSLNELQEETLYFFYLVFNVQFVFQLLTAAITASTTTFFSDPLKFIQSMSLGFPKGASFFINYLILCLAVYPTELLRLPALVYYSLLKIWAETPREYLKITAMSSVLNLGFITPLNILVFVVLLCYAVISPLVVFPGFVYFCLGWLTWKNQLLYVYIKQSEGDGLIWMLIYNRCIFGIYIFQFLISGILSAKLAPYCAIWVGLLMPATYVFNRYCRILFYKHDLYIPMEKIHDVNIHDFTLPAVEIGNSITEIKLGKPLTTTPASEHLNENIAEMNRRQIVSSYRSPVFTKPLRHLWVPAYVYHLYLVDIAEIVEEDQNERTSILVEVKESNPFGDFPRGSSLRKDGPF